MTLPTHYAAGTVTVGAAGTTVTGAGTAWSTNGIQVGDMFLSAGLSVRIASVDSNTQLTLARPWPGAALAGANYEVRYTPDTVRLMASNFATLEELRSGNVSSIAQLDSAANKLAYFTGVGTAGLTDLTEKARELLAGADAGAMLTSLGMSNFVKSLVDETSAQAFLDALGAEAAVLRAGPLFNLMECGGRFAEKPEGTGVGAGAFSAPSYFSAYNSSTFASGGKYLSNNTTYGGSAGALPAVIDELETKIHSVASNRRYGVEYHALQITAGAGTAAPVSGHYLLMTGSLVIPDRMTLGCWVRCTSGSLLLNIKEGAIWVDGVRQTGTKVVTNADGWVHVAWQRRTPIAVGYDTSLFPLYSQPGSVNYMAKPFIFPGVYPLDGLLTDGIGSLRTFR